jgi:prepilin-type N-terminal cleavage/methylation domain-containing protein
MKTQLPAAHPTSRQTTRPPSGFTLLELLVVIAIIMIVSSVLVASYFGMMRSSSYAATEKNVFGALNLARQRACIDGTRVYMMFTNSTDFVLVRSAGRITKNDTTHIYDAYADLSAAANTNMDSRIYNMDTNGMAKLTGIEWVDGRTNNLITRIPYDRPEWCLSIIDQVPAGNFRVGHRYGMEVYQMQRLPEGFYCKVESVGRPALSFPDIAMNNNKVVFEPDGRRGSHSISKIVVYEKIVGESAAANRVTFTIDATGKIAIVPLS